MAWASDRGGQDAGRDGRSVLQEDRESDPGEDRHRVQPRQREECAQPDRGDRGGLAEVALHHAGEPVVEALELGAGSAGQRRGGGGEEDKRQGARDPVTTAVHGGSLGDR
jgi:hypothetical protein